MAQVDPWDWKTDAPEFVPVGMVPAVPAVPMPLPVQTSIWTVTGGPNAGMTWGPAAMQQVGGPGPGAAQGTEGAPGTGGNSEAEDLEIKQLKDHYEWQIQRQDEDMRALQRRMGKLEQRRAELKENWDRERNGLVRDISRYAAVLTRYAIPLEEACEQDGVHEQALQPQLQQAQPQQPQQSPQPQAQKQQNSWAAAPVSTAHTVTSSLDAKMKRLNGLLSDGPAKKGAAESGTDARRDAAGGASQGGSAAATRGSLTTAKEGGAAAQGSGDGVLGGSIASTLQAMFPHATVRTQPEGNDPDTADEAKAGGGAVARGGDDDAEPRKKEGGSFDDADVVALAEELEATTSSQIDDRALRALQSLPASDAMEVLKKVEDLVEAQGGKCRNLSSILQSVCRKLERKAAGRRDPATGGPSAGDADDGALATASPEGDGGAGGPAARGAEGAAVEAHGRAPGELGSDAEADEEGADGSGGGSAEEGDRSRRDRRRRERASDDEESEEGGKEAVEGCHWTARRVEQAASRGFELQQCKPPDEDRWSLRLAMASMDPPLTEDGMIHYCSWLKSRLASFKAEHGLGPLRKCSGEIDFSNNGLSNEAVWALLETLAQFEVHAASLKLSKNKISQGGVLAICEFIRTNKRAGPVHELDLSHNEVDDESALELLRTLRHEASAATRSQKPKYPPLRENESAPVWVRLNQNRIQDSKAALRALDAEGVVHCAAKNCSRTDSPLMHLYLLADQEIQVFKKGQWDSRDDAGCEDEAAEDERLEADADADAQDHGDRDPNRNSRWGIKGEGRPGDWDCPECGARVFASKSACFKCGARKDGGSDARGAGGYDAEGAEGSSASKRKRNRKAKTREYDKATVHQ